MKRLAAFSIENPAFNGTTVSDEGEVQIILKPDTPRAADSTAGQ